MTSTDDQLVADYLRRLAAAAESLPPDRRDELIEEISAHIAEARALSPEAAGQQTPRVADTLARLGQPDDIVRVAAELSDSGQPAGNDDGIIKGGPGGSPPGGYGPSGYGPGGYGPGRYDPGSQSPVGYGPGGAHPSWPSSTSPRRPAAGVGAMEICAVILLLVGAVLAGVGWVVGAILLWISPRWRLSDKLLGTLIWPGGLVGAFFALTVPVSASGAGCDNSGGSGQRTVQQCINPSNTPGWLSMMIVLVILAIALGAPVLVSIRLVRQARRANQHNYPAAA